jgi:hypothetical protein
MHSQRSTVLCLFAIILANFGILGLNGSNSSFPSITCQVLVAHVQYSDPQQEQLALDTEYVCLPVGSTNGLRYQIPRSLIQGNEGLYQNGNAIMQIIGGKLSNGTNVTSDYEVILGNGSYAVFLGLTSRREMSQSSRPAPIVGTRSALVVRVTSADESLPIDATTISQQIFGNGFSLNTVYGNCSLGQLKMVPATGNGINNGVVELSIGVSTVGTSRLSLENAMTTALLSQFNSLSNWDHIIFCLPQSSEKWIAYAYVSGKR